MKASNALSSVMTAAPSAQVRRRRTLAIVLALAMALLVINCRQKRAPEAGYAPPGFDVQLLEILACPENLTSVRLATRNELNVINAKIQSGTLRQWNGTSVQRPIMAALIREDNRVAYEVREGIPIMLIEEALVLDESVGRPHPAEHRKPFT